MLILVDGYNVLKQAYDGEMISEQQRCSFIKQLAAYKRKRSHKKIIVVFDGGPDVSISREKIRGINIVYAGASRTADDYIYSFIQEHKEKADNIILVSSDRQLCQLVSDYGVVSIGAQEFYKLMLQGVKARTKTTKMQQTVKTTTDFLPELDKLMHEVTEKIEIKPEDWPKERESRVGKKLSKQERILLKKVRKL